MPRRKHPDARSAGRSRLIPFTPGDAPEERHQRRLEYNLTAGRAKVEEWCAALAITLTVTDEGHHWQFRRADGWIAEWWPSSAKLVIAKQYDRGVHVHDWTQAVRELARALRRRGVEVK